MPKPNLESHIIIFGRYPKVGRVKTRLIPALGPAGAAALQKRLAERTVSCARRLSAKTGYHLVFCHDGGINKMNGWLGGANIEYRPQVAGDLGQRMYLAICEAFSRGAQRVVLIGTDIPGLTAAILSQAFDRLMHNDLVLGPSTDGGYWLVGMTRPVNIFDGIAWSQSTVLDHTLVVARRKGLRYCQLDPLMDLDTPDDWIRYVGKNIAAMPYLSVIIPTLNEASHLRSTLAAAEAVDSEIIVSDGGSTDDTRDIIQSMGARMVIGRRGSVVQQNRGAAAARGEVLLFLHADTRLPDNYVDTVFETLMHRRTILGAFRFQTTTRAPAMRGVAWWTNRLAQWSKLPCGDQGMFMQKRDFMNAGGFPDVPIAADRCLARRLSHWGRVALVPSAVVNTGSRFQRLGLTRTILVQTSMVLGCLAGAKSNRLASLAALIGKPTRS